MSERESLACRSIRLLVTLFLWGLAGYAVWYYLGQPSPSELGKWAGDIDFGDVSDVLDNLTDFGWDNDPFLSSNSTSSWPTDGTGGLPLTLVNALDSNWYDEFENAVLDWDNGDPDALTLYTEIGDIDHTCEPIDGKMKVCNGNYGDTGWLGINELISSTLTGWVLSSTAKMNEFYLYNADQDQRQYTMCHEIGHGFGLPHTDENFFNEDLGNCMDYTKQPQNNLHPDKSNYLRLQSLYGTADTTASGKRHRHLAARTLKPSKDVRMNYNDAIREIEQDLFEIEEELDIDEFGVDKITGWRRLAETDPSNDRNGGAHYSRYLGEGFELHVHVLYPH